METTQLTPEAPVQPETPERRSAAPRFQLPKKRRKWLKRLVLILAAAGILFLLLRPLLFGSPAASSGQYQPAAVQRQDLTVSVDGSGTMTPIESYQVGALVSGEILPGTVEYVAGADQVGSGGALIRQVKIRVNNPGALTESTSATAKVGTVSCAAGGTFEARLSQTITAQAGGEVTALNVSVGSRISGGEPLATLGGSAAETALQNAALSLQNAQLSLQSAQEVLENYTITSPISGTVIEKNLKAGDQLDGSESGALAVIYDLEQLELKMNVSELDIGKIRPGQSVEITAEALPGETFLGTVEKVNINGTTTDGFTTYPVTILLSEYGALNPGMNVSADIIVEQAQQALCIPTPAVSGGNTVLVAPDGALGEDGSVLDPAKLETRQVELGRSSQDYVEILSGLEEGETVLVPIQSADGSAGSTAVMASGG